MGSDVFNVANGLGLAFGSPGEMTPLALPLAAIAASVDFMVNFFEDLFGGSESPPTPRQLLHGRHPLYPVILGVSDSLTPTMESQGKPDFCGDPEWCGKKPLQKVQYRPTPAPDAGLTPDQQNKVLRWYLGGMTARQAWEMYLQREMTEGEYCFFLLLNSGPRPTPTPEPNYLALG